MKQKRFNPGGTSLRWLVLVLMLATTSIVQAVQVTLNVVDSEGVGVEGFRWLLQEDTTFAVDPNSPATNPDDLLSMSFHASNHPPAVSEPNSTTNSPGGAGLSGNSDGNTTTIEDVATNPGRYYVSVMPYAGYSISGAQVDVSAGDATVEVTVQKQPIPTAQIAIYLFEDRHPINGVPDLPEETNPLAGEPGHVDWSQFTLFLEEPAGQYGHNGGQVIQDAFGNPLGTTYIKGCDADGQPDADFFTDYGCLNPDGTPQILVAGDGTLHPTPEGYLTVENLAPGKYGVVMTPPPNQGWQQTSTIEGSKVIDAWVKANEPPFFVEFGLPGPHVFVGFLRSNTFEMPPGGVANVSGTITDMHMSRAPNFQFYSGRLFPQCWVGLNKVDAVGGLGEGVYAEPCDADSNFIIPNVPEGNYQLAIWDANLDVVLAAQPFTVDAGGTTCDGGGSCSFGEIPVFNWFARLNASVFNDVNQNGFWDADEGPVGPEGGPVTLRWRDGTLYQEFPTDGDGLAPFDTVFPFFHWLVAEVGFTSKKATGATIVVDAGGEVRADGGWVDPTFGETNPQPQCDPVGIGFVGDIVINSTDTRGSIGDCLTGTVEPDGTITWVVDNARQQINPNTLNNLSRTEIGQVLTAGFQGFLGQTSAIQFGKAEYQVYTDINHPTDPFVFIGENGGISGIVYYATTRAEDDPRFAAWETWEPGIPRVQVALYADGDIDCFPQGDFPNSVCDIDWNQNFDPDNPTLPESDDGVIDDINGNGVVDLADVDNYPLGWGDPACVDDPDIPGNPCIRGTEDVDHNDNGSFDYGDAIAITWTDSWDDSLPTDCQGQNRIDFNLDGTISPAEDARCFDGLRNFNQIRPAVFDGGYAFNNYDLTNLPLAIRNKLTAFYSSRNDMVENLPTEWMVPGDYIVEAATPVGYKLVQEEHKNVDFGDAYIPSTQGIAGACAGDLDPVPEYLAMSTKDGSGDASQLITGVEAIPAPFAGTERPLCDRKLVPLSAGQNAAAEFFLMTDVPLVANATGVILNDLANEFNPNSPAFGEKFAPPMVPIAFYDWNGNQVSRVYSDTYGRYNTVLPSTITANLPMPSGMSPNMLVSCMNDAGPIPNPAFATDPEAPEFIIDPAFNPQFSQFCYTFQYMPGSTTYLDTPVEPVAAFASFNGLDCERPTATPMIASVSRDLVGQQDGPFVVDGDTITITSRGTVQVPNPQWDGVDLATRTILRDYSFGEVPGAVILEDAAGNLVATLGVTSWVPEAITATVSGVVLGEYQVVVRNVNGESPMGVTLTVGSVDADGEYILTGKNLNRKARVWRVPSIEFASIQEAIGDINATLTPNGVEDGDLILVAPGIYNEMVVMWKPVKLQGWGAESVIINARQSPTEALAAWRQLTTELVSGGFIDPLEGQTIAPLGFPALAEALFPSEEGAGIFVAGNDKLNFEGQRARIDGLTVIGASQGGGIVLNGYAQETLIGNNVVESNSGIFGGGIRVGHHNISHQLPNGDLVYDDAMNDNVRIHHNHVAKNGNTNGTGGGISLHPGADNYQVQENWICGNFSKGDGGGIAHFGVSDNGLIEDNLITFNETFNQMPGTTPSGAGVFIGGQPALQIDNGTGLMLTPGTGNVVVDSNIIRGNLAGAGDGSGINLKAVNGLDVSDSLNKSDDWYQVSLYNNMVTNNVAGVAGAVALYDALKVEILHNTIANNDSTATGSQAFQVGSPNMSVPQPAGVVSRTHSDVMIALIGELGSRVVVNGDFSEPLLQANIVFQNRSYYWLNSTPDAQQGDVTITGIYPAYCDPTAIDPADPTTCDVTNVEDYTWDMAVMNGVISADQFTLTPTNSLLTANVGNYVDPSNFYQVTNPGTDLLNPLDEVFANSYFNVPKQNLLQNEFKTLQTAAAFDEGGNFIQVAYDPLTLLDLLDMDIVQNGADLEDNSTVLYDYHLAAGSPALGVGGPVVIPAVDIDNQGRVDPTDSGADEQL